MLSLHAVSRFRINSYRLRKLLAQVCNSLHNAHVEAYMESIGQLHRELRSEHFFSKLYRKMFILR